MLTVRTLPILLKIVGKLDLKPLIGALKELDIFDDVKSATEVTQQLSKEKLGIVAFEVIAALAPQLGKIADDLPQLAAVYKGIGLEEANELDAAELINDLINDEGVTSFFKRALRKKAEQGA